MKMRLSDVKKYLADLFLPNRCPACSKVIPWDKTVCRKCRDKLTVITEELCPVCAKSKCIDHSKLCFDSCIALFYYVQPCINAIYALKYHKGSNFAEYSADLLKTELENRELADRIDLVTCVPMSVKKLRRRKYNQSEMMARYLSDRLGKPLDTSLIVHSDTLTDHHTLPKSQKAENALSSFCVSQHHSDIKGKTVLLCDDVYTTGSTMNACAACLRQLGAKSVIAAAIATTKPVEKRYDEGG